MNKEILEQNGINIIDSQKCDLGAFLRSNFPQTFTDGRVNLAIIAQLLGVNDSFNGYELTFPGKALANALYNAPCQKLLKHETTINSDEILPNFIIKGDNLDALKVLNHAYNGKIKMIYIDPPYNTKNENFIYPDDFRKDFKKILTDVGLLDVDENGNEVESESLRFFKNIASSRSHSGWLAFMLPRLKLARDLLKDDGVIFISIDDNEMANLKILCDEIFGEENFVADFVWEHRKSSQNDIDISLSHNYNLCYAKDRSIFKLNRQETKAEKFSNPDNDPRGEWVADPFDAPNIRENLSYPIINPNTKEAFYPPKGRCWRMSKEKFEEALADNRIVFGKSGKTKPQYKRFKFEAEAKGENVFTIWTDCGTATNGTKELQSIFNGDKIFDTPKPINLIKKIIQLSTTPNNNDIILDFFAGSGTTAHAVMDQNESDGGNRKFILVQLDEIIDEKRSKTAYDFVKNELKILEPKISDITIERVKRAAKNGETFSIFSLENVPQILPDSLNLKISNLTPLDEALNLALKAGICIGKNLTPACQNALYSVDKSHFVVDINQEVLEFAKKRKEDNFYFSIYSDFEISDILNLKETLNSRLNALT